MFFETEFTIVCRQLMFDRRHLIAEELAADLSLSALALASSDALLRIIKKSRGKLSNLSAQWLIIVIIPVKIVDQTTPTIVVTF